MDTFIKVSFSSLLMTTIDRDHPMCPSVAAWATAAASLPLMIICGSVYTFGLYSEQLKLALDLSQVLPVGVCVRSSSQVQCVAVKDLCDAR